MIPWYNKLLQSCPILLQGLKNKNLAKVVKCKISQITNYNLSRKMLPLNLFFFRFMWTIGRSTLVKQRPIKSLLSICPSVTKFSQDWIISFLWYCTWWSLTIIIYWLTSSARWAKIGLKTIFLTFSYVWLIGFLWNCIQW